MCNVNISESIRVMLDNEIDVTIDDDAWLYDSDADEYEASDEG